MRTAIKCSVSYNGMWGEECHFCGIWAEIPSLFLNCMYIHIYNIYIYINICIIFIWLHQVLVAAHGLSCPAVRRILVPRPEIKSVSPAWKVVFNHWTTREDPRNTKFLGTHQLNLLAAFHPLHVIYRATKAR